LFAVAFSVILTGRTHVLFPSAEVLTVWFWGREDEAIHPYLPALRHASLLSVEIKPVQLLPPLPPLRQGVIQQVRVLLPMMMLLQMTSFMQQHGVNAVHGSLYEPGIERDQT
jgi:hypothetical protein